MVLLGGDGWAAAYRTIRHDALDNECSILILVANDADALCAAKILTTLLKGDFLKYALVPVSCYSDFRHVAANEMHADNLDGIKTVIMINCGGPINLADFFPIENGPKYYVIDSHRPLNLDNIYTDRVYILHDGETFDIPEHKDVFDSDGDDDMNSDDEDREFVEERAAQRRRLEEGGMVEVGEHLTRRQRRQTRSLLRDKYYHGSYFGGSSAHVLYRFAEALGKATNPLLWMAIVGVTDLYIHERMDHTRYLNDVISLQADVTRNNHDEDEAENSDPTLPDAIRIRYEEEFRFMLTRHWNLYDSMLHSRYIVSRLGTWTDRGRKNLQEILAKMGMPLSECKQKYTSMGSDFKNGLQEQLSERAKEFNLQNVKFPSFSAKIGFRLQISASDVVYAVNSLLQAVVENDESTEDPRHAWKANFYTAFDALATDRHVNAKLQRGLDYSMKHQRVIVQQMSGMFAKKAVSTIINFRFASIENLPEQQKFLHALTLLNLAHFVVDAYRENRTSKSALPLVLAALNNQTDQYLIVGVMPSAKTEDVGRNMFASAFKTAATAIKAQYRHDGFDSAVIMIQRADQRRFLEHLNDVLNAN